MFRFSRVTLTVSWLFEVSVAVDFCTSAAEHCWTCVMNMKGPSARYGITVEMLRSSWSSQLSPIMWPSLWFFKECKTNTTSSVASSWNTHSSEHTVRAHAQNPNSAAHFCTYSLKGLTVLCGRGSTVITTWSLKVRITVSSKAGLFPAVTHTICLYAQMYITEKSIWMHPWHTWWRQLLLAVRRQSVHDEVSLHVSEAQVLRPSFHLVSQSSEAGGQPLVGVQACTAALHTDMHVTVNASHSYFT